MPLSDIELYFSIYIKDNSVSVVGEEAHHLMKVMRHSTGDEIYVTNGNGKIFQSVITSTEKNEVKAEIKHTHKFENKLKNFTVVIPRLRTADRFEFAIEKCVELGFTNFIVFESERTIAKGDKSDRWKKILTAAMKQSLRSYLPTVKYVKSFDKLNELEGTKILFDQNSKEKLKDSFKVFEPGKKFILIFGPEGGLTEQELTLFDEAYTFSLSENRLRAETAVISAAAVVNTFYDQ